MLQKLGLCQRLVQQHSKPDSNDKLSKIKGNKGVHTYIQRMDNRASGLLEEPGGADHIVQRYSQLHSDRSY